MVCGVGAGSRGAAAPLKIFWALLGDLRPPENCFPSHFFREYLLLGQERGPNLAKTFFLKERLFLEQKSGPNPAKTFFFGVSSFSPPPVQK